MSCKITKIENRYRKSNPELADKLNQQTFDTWNTLLDSKLFEEKDDELYVNKEGTKKRVKQDELIDSINNTTQKNRSTISTDSNLKIKSDFDETYWKNVYSQVKNNKEDIQDILIPTIQNKYRPDEFNVYQGTNIFEIDEKDNLILRPSNNFNDKTTSISLTQIPVVAQDYMLRKNGKYIIKIKNDNIKDKYSIESAEEISINGDELLIIPKNSYEIIIVPTFLEQKQKEYENEIKKLENSYIADFNKDPIAFIDYLLRFNFEQDELEEIYETSLGGTKPSWFKGSETLKGIAIRNLLSKYILNYKYTANFEESLVKNISDYILLNGIFWNKKQEKVELINLYESVFGYEHDIKDRSSFLKELTFMLKINKEDFIKIENSIKDRLTLKNQELLKNKIKNNAIQNLKELVKLNNKNVNDTLDKQEQIKIAKKSYRDNLILNKKISDLSNDNRDAMRNLVEEYKKNNMNFLNSFEKEIVSEQPQTKDIVQITEDNKVSVDVLRESNQSLQEGLDWLKSVNPNVQPEIVQGLIDSINNDVLYQNQTNSSEGQIASEKTIRDLAARMSDRIGISIKFESDRSKDYKGKIENNTAYINLAYATLDTAIHEIAGHSIIRALKIKSEKTTESYLQDMIDKGIITKEC